MVRPCVDPAAQRALLRWYKAHRRDLPWRRAPHAGDPYAVLVSEAMLQQTRVDVVVAYYEAWMRRFPTVEALARAPEREVLAAWSGLGYYRRARNLHAAARTVVQDLAGRVPDDVEGLRALPGVGPYTAGAVASIAFARAVAAVDGNVIRVLARQGALRGAAQDAALRRRVDAAAAALAGRQRHPGDWNQALMELGATVCTPRAPDCGRCPVARTCAARGQGVQTGIPAPRARKAPAWEPHHAAYVTRRRRGQLEVLLARGEPGGLLDAMRVLPGGSQDDALADLVLRTTGIAVQVGPVAASVRHAFSHRRWNVAVHTARAVGPSSLRAGADWVAVAALEREPMSALARKCIAAAQTHSAVAGRRSPGPRAARTVSIPLI